MGSIEMDECINEGSIPIFGYPMVSLSPRGAKSSDIFWSMIYKSTMKVRKKDQPNIIGDLLDQHQEFIIEQEEFKKDLTTGFYCNKKNHGHNNKFQAHVCGHDSKQAQMFEKAQLEKARMEKIRGLRPQESKPEDSGQNTKKEDRPLLFEYKSNMEKFLRMIKKD